MGDSHVITTRLQTAVDSQSPELVSEQARESAVNPPGERFASGHPQLPAEEELIIEAGRAERQYWRDLWRYRELFYFLAWRDVLVRYKQTTIGVAWAVLRPLLTMLVFTIIFGRLAKLPADGGAPYPILVFAAMLPWQFFASALSECGGSVLANA